MASGVSSAEPVANSTLRLTAGAAASGWPIWMPRVAGPPGVGLSERTISSTDGLFCAHAGDVASEASMASTLAVKRMAMLRSTADVDDLDAAVALLRGLVGCRDQQPVLSHADRLHAGAVDVEAASQVVHHRVGAALRQVLVVFPGADRVGMP